MLRSKLNSKQREDREKIRMVTKVTKALYWKHPTSPKIHYSKGSLVRRLRVRVKVRVRVRVRVGG